MSIMALLPNTPWPIARLVVIDRRGYGASPDLAQHAYQSDYEIDAQDVAELLANGAHLVGHSYGGVVAMLAAARCPQAICSLTLIEPGAYRVAEYDPAVAAVLQGMHEGMKQAPPTLSAEQWLRFSTESVGLPVKESQGGRIINISVEKTCKFLTLFRPATGELRAEPVDASPNAILPPWLKKELEVILTQCPPAPEERRWQNWDPFPAAEQLDRFLPPLRMLLILDNLAGHSSRDLVSWCHERGIGLLYTPCAGSWLNMAESVQRIIIRRALEGHHIYNVEILKDWLRDTIEGWKRHPTPFIWGGKRHARRDRAYARRHRQGGSGATTQYVLPRRIRSVRFYRHTGNATAVGK